jgi:beta-N-acetylhexosaminidase
LLAAAFVQALLAALGLSAGPESGVASLTAREKAGLVVVSGLPAPRGVAGVLVRSWDRGKPRPPGALVFVDQEGGAVRAFPDLPPTRPATTYRTAGEAFAAGRATGSALRRAGVDVDLAPVLDSAGGPLGSRHFRRGALGVAFARGLGAAGIAGCAKHFPGLGAAAASTDVQVWVPAKIRRREIAAFGSVIAAGVPCVMTSHAVYERFGWRRAVIAPGAYRMLRRLGFGGVTITDSLSIIRTGPWPERWSRRAVAAGADLVLFTSSAHARRAIRALLPLARRGALDRHVAGVLAFRRSLRLSGP